jgi:hypothetical protein
VLRALTILVGLALLAGTARAQQAPPAQPPAPEEPQAGAAVLEVGARVWERTWEELEGQSIALGAGYTQGTLKFPQFHGDPRAQPQITDNGRFSLLAQFRTEEQYLAQWPLEAGRAAIGYNFVASYGRLAVDRQLRSSAFSGDDVGTAVSGDYLVVAPVALLRLGPLYPTRAVFWKFALGLGGGLVRFEGEVLPRVDLPDSWPKERVSTEGSAPAFYVTVLWELQMEQWLLLFQSLYLRGFAGNDLFLYEVFSLSLGYTIRF